MLAASRPLLLLLGCACAARADVAEPAPENALTKNYEGYCHTESRGYTSRITTNLPEVIIPAGEQDFIVDIPNKCMELSLELVGGVVTACDADAAPALLLAPAAAGLASVRRRGARRHAAHCYIRLYCI